MLCPEVWSFPASENIINLKDGALDENVQKSLFERRYFNEMVSFSFIFLTLLHILHIASLAKYAYR